MLRVSRPSFKMKPNSTPSRLLILLRMKSTLYMVSAMWSCLHLQSHPVHTGSPSLWCNYTSRLLIHLAAKLTPSLTHLPSSSLCLYCPSLESQLRGLEHSFSTRFPLTVQSKLAPPSCPISFLFPLATTKGLSRWR